jgi:hypothetical protein
MYADAMLMLMLMDADADAASAIAPYYGSGRCGDEGGEQASYIVETFIPYSAAGDNTQLTTVLQYDGPCASSSVLL